MVGIKSTKMAIIAISAFIIFIAILALLIYNYFIHNSGIKVGGDYENIRIMNTTRELKLTMVYETYITEELDYYFIDYTTKKQLEEKYDIQLDEVNTENIIVSFGRKIEQLVYDANWRLYHYEEGWGFIAIPKFTNDFNPNVIYIYITEFPDSIYNGDLHKYIYDIRYINDIPKWDVELWTTNKSL